MYDVVVINNKEVAFESTGGIVYTDSLSLADVFEKRHSDVIRAIERLPQDDFTERNFALSSYIDASGKQNKMYKMTRDGYSMVVMGFTGREAYEWKKQYIEAFNLLEKRWRGGMVAGQNLSAVVEMVAENLARLGEVVATLSAQMERLDRRLQIYEAAEAYRRERARRRALRKPTTNALVAQAYEGRRAQFMTLVHGVLMQAKGELSQGELLRRSGYRRDDKTARRWLQEGIGVYWEVRAKGRSLCYRLIKAQEAA